MCIDFGREICGYLEIAEQREWLVTNGIGGYASGTIPGLLTRRYHGLLVAPLDPPLGRTLLLAKLHESVLYGGKIYQLHTNRWQDGIVSPDGYLHIQRFFLEGAIPVWEYACADALIEKRIWMQQGANTTYIQYVVRRATEPISLTLKALVNYRDFHKDTQANGWKMTVEKVPNGVSVSGYPRAVPLYMFSDRAIASSIHNWYYGFDLAAERNRGLQDREDHLHTATFKGTLKQGETLTFVASTDPQAETDGEGALNIRRTQEEKIVRLCKSKRPNQNQEIPDWIKQLILAADQFVVNRPLPNDPQSKTIIAGYHWFGDWGRDTMISLPGLTLTTGRPEVARSIIRTYAKYIDQGMLPNRFPDEGHTPDYNTVDATLWYFEAIRAYYSATQDDDLLHEIFPVLMDIIDWHRKGTRYNIHLDNSDGLLYAGEEGVQLTWMDAKVDDWVVTPRIGKPVEINALWYNALRVMANITSKIGKSTQECDLLANKTQASFSRFWNQKLGYCYDVIDGPEGNDTSLRPNQIFAVSLPTPDKPLLSSEQQKKVVDICGRSLLTSYGLRSLDPDHPQYKDKYFGNQYQRDSAYHQGTVWGWLIGAFVQAHLRVYQNPVQSRQFLEPMSNHLLTHGIGSLSEIFDGGAPMTPRGCIAEAWTVAEVLRAWFATE